MAKRLKIAYVTSYDAKDVNNWSGLGVYIARTLEKYIGDVEYIGAMDYRESFIDFLIKGATRLFSNKEYLTDRTERAGKHYARIVEEKITGKKFDLIFSPGTIPIAWLKTDIPIIFWTDGTFASMVDYYYTNLSEKTIENGNALELKALKNCELAIYCSDWAASSAINDYNIDPRKVHIIPFGANIENVTGIRNTTQKPGSPIRLLLVGKDWERKGGSIAYDTLLELGKSGIPAHLTIVGCRPPEGVQAPNLTVYEFLDKNKKEDSETLHNLYLNSDFFLLPTRSECFGIVLSEANSFGLPAITTNTGGLATVVQDGVNGYMLPLSATGKDFANKIADLVNDPEHYIALRNGARKKFEEVLNWESAGKELAKLLESKGIA